MKKIILIMAVCLLEAWQLKHRTSKRSKRW